MAKEVIKQMNNLCHFNAATSLLHVSFCFFQIPNFLLLIPLLLNPPPPPYTPPPHTPSHKKPHATRPYQAPLPREVGALRVPELTSHFEGQFVDNMSHARDTFSGGNHPGLVRGSLCHVGFDESRVEETHDDAVLLGVNGETLAHHVDRCLARTVAVVFATGIVVNGAEARRNNAVL